MQLDTITSLLEDLQAALARDGDLGKWEARETLGTTVEELRVADEEVRLQNRKLVETRLTVDRERQRYRDLFELAPDPFLETNGQGMILMANRAAAQLLNVAQPFLIGKPLPLYVVESERTGFRAELHRLTRSTGVFRYELRLRPRNEPEIPVMAAVVRMPAQNENEGDGTFLWSLRDETLVKRAEQQLRLQNTTLERQIRERTVQLEKEMEAREQLLISAHSAYGVTEATGDAFVDLVQNLDAIIWKTDAATGRYTFVSQRAVELFGPEAGDWVSDPDAWRRLVPADDWEYLQAIRHRAAREGRHGEAEYRLRAPDGRVLWFRENVRVVNGPDGRPCELRGLMVDITRRKRIERQLYAAKTELQTRLDDMTYLRELSLRLLSPRDPDGRWGEALHAVISLLGAEQGVAALRDETGGTPRIAAACGLSEDTLEAVAGAAARVGSAWSAEPLILPDLSETAKDDLYANTLHALGVGALTRFLPRTRAGRVVGAIVAFFQEPHRPGDRQIELTTTYLAEVAEILDLTPPPSLT